MSSSVATPTPPIAPEPPIAKAESRLALIKEAILGSSRDFTAVSVDRAIFLLAVPMVLEMAMEGLFALVDTYFVAHLGADATATVGITESMLAMMYAIAVGMSMGTTAVVARRTGEKDGPGAAQAAVQSMILGIGISALIFALCFAFAPQMLAWMGASPSILHVGSTYCSIMLSGSGVILMLFLINAIFRGAGDAAVAMRVLWLANAINICLDIWLIPRLGVTGAAIATTTGRSIGILFQLYLLWRGRGRIAIQREHLRINFTIMKNILRLAGNGILQFLAATGSWMIMVRLIQSFGSAATAGYTVAIRIVYFSILPSWGLGSAAATLVGQNLGAKQPEQAEQAVWRASFFNMVFLGGLSLVFLLFAPQLIGVFSHDAAVIATGASCLRIISICYVLFAYGMVIVQAFNGAGDTFTPTVINLVCYWILQLPLSFLLSRRFQFGPNGIFIAILITEVLLAIVSIFVFRLGRWKMKVV